MTWLWAAVVFVSLLAELHTNTFHAVHEAVAAALVALLSRFWPNVAVQVLVFGLLSWLLLAFVRPRLVQLLVRVRPRPTRPYPDLVEREAIVRERVTGYAGLVEVGQGEFWSARAFAPGEVFEPGTHVLVAQRVGLRLLVEAEPPCGPRPPLA
jgi:membrane protein implicated in regulation of membrane protease activity